MQMTCPRANSSWGVCAITHVPPTSMYQVSLKRVRALMIATQPQAVPDLVGKMNDAEEFAGGCLLGGHRSTEGGSQKVLQRGGAHIEY